MFARKGSKLGCWMAAGCCVAALLAAVPGQPVRAAGLLIADSVLAGF